VNPFAAPETRDEEAVKSALTERRKRLSIIAGIACLLCTAAIPFALYRELLVGVVTATAILLGLIAVNLDPGLHAAQGDANRRQRRIVIFILLASIAALLSTSVYQHIHRQRALTKALQRLQQTRRSESTSKSLEGSSSEQQASPTSR